MSSHLWLPNRFPFWCTKSVPIFGYQVRFPSVGAKSVTVLWYQIGSHFWEPNMLPFRGISSVTIFGYRIGSHFWVPNRLPFLGTKSVTKFGYQIGYNFWVPIRCHILESLLSKYEHKIQNCSAANMLAAERFWIVRSYLDINNLKCDTELVPTNGNRFGTQKG